jgi:type IV pilus assembly protein PilF
VGTRFPLTFNRHFASVPTLSKRNHWDKVARWRIWATLLALVGCGCGATTVRSDPEASEKRYLLGADYFAKGAVRPALEELLKAVELNPQNAEAHNLLGIVFLRQAADAEEMTERANCVKGEEARLSLTEREGSWKKAEEQFRLATTLRPQFSEAWNNLAVVQIQFRSWDEAIASSSQALANIVYAEPWAAQGNLGWAYFHKKEFARATKELRTALYANPKFCVGRYRLAKVMAEQSDLEGALSELAVLTADRACPIQEAFHLLGMLSLRRGATEDRPRAAEAFRRCVELAPRSCLASQCRIAN